MIVNFRTNKISECIIKLTPIYILIKNNNNNNNKKKKKEVLAGSRDFSMMK
jgi:hypothetical protein